MKILIQIIRGILMLVWAALLALSILFYASANIAGDDPPQLFDWACYTVPDSAMSPELVKGDLAILRMDQTAQPGDAVLCPNSLGKPMLTRIIGTSEGQLILKQDGTEESRLAAESDVLGVSAGYLPGLGPIFGFLHSLPGVLVIFAAGLALTVLPGLLLRPVEPKLRVQPARPVEPSQRTRPVRPAEAEQQRNSSPQRPRSGYTPRH